MDAILERDGIFTWKAFDGNEQELSKNNVFAEKKFHLSSVSEHFKSLLGFLKKQESSKN